MKDETKELTEEELRSRLNELLLRAYENDVDIVGGWGCHNGDGHPDWDVVITEVRKDGGSD